MAAKKKTCFVISPIGDEGTEIRTRADIVFDHIISPPVIELGHEITRADKIEKAGIITSQIIQAIFDSDVVVADLTDWNPNVFYELALRHAVHKPVVQIIGVGQKIPFDVTQLRTIFFDHQNLPSAKQASQKIKEQIQNLSSEPDAFDNPVSTAVSLKDLGKNGAPIDSALNEILKMLHEINTRFAESDSRKYFDDYERMIQIRRMSFNAASLENREIQTIYKKLEEPLNEIKWQYSKLVTNISRLHDSDENRENSQSLVSISARKMQKPIEQMTQLLEELGKRRDRS